jgi:hypothetical protein
LVWIRGIDDLGYGGYAIENLADLGGRLAALKKDGIPYPD